MNITATRSGSITLKFNRRPFGYVAGAPVKCQDDTITENMLNAVMKCA